MQAHTHMLACTHVYTCTGTHFHTHAHAHAHTHSHLGKKKEENPLTEKWSANGRTWSSLGSGKSESLN